MPVIIQVHPYCKIRDICSKKKSLLVTGIQPHIFTRHNHYSQLGIYAFEPVLSNIVATSYVWLLKIKLIKI